MWAQIRAPPCARNHCALYGNGHSTSPIAKVLKFVCSSKKCLSFPGLPKPRKCPLIPLSCPLPGSQMRNRLGQGFGSHWSGTVDTPCPFPNGAVQILFPALSCFLSHPFSLCFSPCVCPLEDPGDTGQASWGLAASWLWGSGGVPGHRMISSSVYLPTHPKACALRSWG